MVNKGPELLKCAEDDDFLAEFDKMITEVSYYDNKSIMKMGANYWNKSWAIAFAFF